jgi:hypothetical protein
MRPEAKYARAFVFAFTLCAALLYAYLAAGPVFNLIDGTAAERFPVFVFMAANFLSILLMLVIVVEPNDPVLVDIQQLMSVFAIIINGAIASLFLGYYLFYINTSFSGGSSFNDYRWCSVYPDQCGYLTGIPLTLSVNDEFKQLWIFSGVFFVISYIFFVCNGELRSTGAVIAPDGNPDKGKLLGAVYVVAAAGSFAYWASVTLFNTLYIHGYPTIGIPPNPGPYSSFLYGWQWWLLWVISLHWICFLLFAISLVDNVSSYVGKAHFALNAILGLVDVGIVLALIFAMLPIPYIGYCNSFTSGGSICNSYLWCLSYFADAPNLCNNVSPRNVWLFPNAEYVQHILFACLCVFWCQLGRWMNDQMSVYGVYS